MKNDSKFLFFELLWIRSGRDSPCRQARKRFTFCSLSRHSPYTSKSTDRRLRASSTRLTVALSVHGSLLSRKSKQGHSKKAASGTGVGIETGHTGCKNHYTNYFTPAARIIILIILNKIYKLLVENLFFGRQEETGDGSEGDRGEGDRGRFCVSYPRERDKEPSPVS